MRHILKLLAIVVLTSNVAACDFMNGVTRHANIGDISLPIECVADVTKSVPGVENVQVRLEEGSRQLTWSGIQEPEQIQRVFYDYEGLRGNFYFISDYQGKTEFHHTYILINATPPQEEVDTIRMAMTAIEFAITEACSIQLSPPQLIEDCYGVVCE